MDRGVKKCALHRFKLTLQGVALIYSCLVVFVHQIVNHKNNLNHTALLHGDNDSMSSILSDDSMAQSAFSSITTQY